MLNSVSKSLATTTLVAVVSLLLSAASILAAPKSTIQFSDVINDANAVASMNGGWTVMRATGHSMEPYFGENSVLLVDTAATSTIAPGMVVIYRDSEGDLVGHKVVSIVENGFITRGINNDRADPEIVTTDRIQGVIFGVLNASDSAPSDDQHLVVMGKSR